MRLFNGGAIIVARVELTAGKIYEPKRFMVF